MAMDPRNRYFCLQILGRHAASRPYIFFVVVNAEPLCQCVTILRISDEGVILKDPRTVGQIYFDFSTLTPTVCQFHRCENGHSGPSNELDEEVATVIRTVASIGLGAVTVSCRFPDVVAWSRVHGRRR